MGLKIRNNWVILSFILIISCDSDKKAKQEYENFLLGEWKGQGEHLYFSKDYFKYNIYKKNLWSISKWKIIKVDKKRKLFYIHFYDTKLTEYAISINKKYGLPVENIIKPVTFIYVIDKQKIIVFKDNKTKENILKKVSEKQKP